MKQWTGGYGYIVSIVGPMFAEKTGELIKECLNQEAYGGRKYIAYKPAIDTRFDDTRIVSRLSTIVNGEQFRLSIPAKTLPEYIDDETIEKVLQDINKYDVFAFDEIQLYKGKISDLILELFYNKKLVIAAGLNMSYEGRPYNNIGDIMAISNEVIIKTAFCRCCKGVATHTQRLKNGEPAPKEELNMIGDNKTKNKDIYTYEPRCGLCFVPPHKVK